MLRKKTTLLVVHVTATPPNQDIGVKEVRAMHKARGFSDIGYHFVIRRDGRVEAGRPEKDTGAHVAGFNSISIGISMVGGVNAKGKAEDNATPAQYAALEAKLAELAAKYPDARICGHRDLSPDGNRDGVIVPAEWIKECPCFNAIPWASSKGLPAADIKGQWANEAPIPGAPVAPLGPDSRDAYLQRLLARAGYQFGPIDGYIGKRTKAAIRAMQTATGLAISGAFDVPTVARLRTMFEVTRAA